MFKDMLKYLRTSHGISQAELARMIGVSNSAIGMYETGEREPNFEIEEKMADYFNVSLDTLRGKAPVASPIELNKLTEQNKARLLAYYQALIDAQEDSK